MKKTSISLKTLVLILAGATTNALAQPAGPAQQSDGRLIGRDASGLIDFVFDPHGRPAAAMTNPTAMARAARRLIAEERETLGLPPGYDLARIVAGPPEAVSEQVMRVAVHETWRGMRVLGSELSLLFARDGRYLGFVGRFSAPGDIASDPSFDVAQAVAALESKQELAPRPRRTQRVGQQRFVVRTERRDEAIEAERVADPEHGTVAWELRAADRTWLVSETTGEVLARREHIAHSDEAIVRRDVVRATLGSQTADWRLGLGNIGLAGPATTKVMKSYFDPGHTLCQYMLQSGLGSGTQNESFPRVDDRSGVDDYVTPPLPYCTAAGFNQLPCGLGFQCGPADNDGSYFRQQTYHSYLAEGLDIVRGAVHPFVPPDSGWDVALAIDEPLTGTCGNDSACFRYTPWFRGVFMTTRNSSVAFLWHELGHYFDWTYGNLGGNCNDADESIAVKETLADVFASLLAKRQFDPRYRDRFTRNQYDFGMHSENANRVNFVAGSQGCAANGTYGMGEAFYQAMWEIAFGFNCDQVACDPDDAGVSARPNAGDIAWAGNQESSEQLLRALAFSLKTVGGGITFRQLAALIYLDIGNRLGGFAAGSRASKIAAVFAHHGLM